MTLPPRCARCDEPIAGGKCSTCDREVAFKYVRREIVALAVLSAVTAGGFMLTRAAAGAIHARRLRDAAEWYAAGERQLAGGQPAAAVSALRRAAAIDHANTEYQLALATALAADQQDAAATQVLLRIRESMPEDPEVNVQLARLAARNNDREGTVRYYENAVYGMWTGDQGDVRRALRVELIRYLLDRQQRARALSELLILSGNLPDDGSALAEAGQLFLEAGEPQRALQHFQRALRTDPKNEGALAGAGEAAFAAGDYRTAQRYLRAIASPSEHLAAVLATTDLVLARDPLRPGLSPRQRRNRTMLNLAHARHMLDECQAAAPARSDAEPFDRESLQAEAATLERQLTANALQDSTPSIEHAGDLVYRIEQQIVARCGGSALDRALLLIGGRDHADRR